MTILKALLVGVSDYSKMPPSPQISTRRPSAKLDVAEMMGLLETLANPGVAHPNLQIPRRRSHSTGPYSDVEVWTLLGGDDARLNEIEEGLDWLCQPVNIQEDVQLLLYFSGHAMLVPTGVAGQYEEVLLPSDTNWNPSSPTCLRAEDVVHRGEAALQRGACIEIVLEACSTSVFVVGPTPTVPTDFLKFGCFFGGGAFPAGSGAVWAASQIQEYSHSGPIPACEDADMQGLFTHFFCKNFPRPNIQKKLESRQILLNRIGADLVSYANDHEECCECCETLEQVPGLYCTAAAAEQRPLSGNCAGSSGPFSMPAGCAGPKLPQPMPFGGRVIDVDTVPVRGPTPFKGTGRRKRGR